jgi:hypothetical protein
MSALALAASLGACLGIAGCGANDDRPANWSYISAAIIQPNCATANCHSALSARSGVNLDTISNGYHALVDRRFVVPGNPQGSALHQLLRGQGTRRMPPDTELPGEDILLIDKWIMLGAAKDVGVTK